MEKNGQKSGAIFRGLKQDINRPLTAILTLNTVAHTMGAAGVGAQAARVFGDEALGVISAVLTFMILVFSEIIPKTLGASYWKALAPATAYCLKFLVWALYPFVVMSEFITRFLVKEKESQGFQRDEFAVMAQLSAKEGHIDKEEATILENISLFKQFKVADAMTPRTVMTCLSDELTVEEFYHKQQKVRFSRIPIYSEDNDDITGYIMRNDLLIAQARGNTDKKLNDYKRNIPTLLDTMSLSHAMKELVSGKSHISLIVNEYGTVKGILTLEDILETLIGQEIVDEDDQHVDMQKVANRIGQARAKKYGVEK